MDSRSSVMRRQWPDRLDVARGAAEHQFCLLADRENVFSALDAGDRHHRRLVEDDAAPFYIDQGVGRAEIDRHVGRQQTQHSSKHLRAHPRLRAILSSHSSTKRPAHRIAGKMTSCPECLNGALGRGRRSSPIRSDPGDCAGTGANYIWRRRRADGLSASGGVSQDDRQPQSIPQETPARGESFKEALGH